MFCRYLLSDQHGDIELTKDDLRRPFLVSPTEKHPFLTLGDYFAALKDFFAGEAGDCLRLLFPGPAFPDNIAAVTIRSEKHGAFYHIASVEIEGARGSRAKAAVTSAITAPACSSLQMEYTLLRRLAGIAPDIIPEVYCLERVTRQTGAGQGEFLVMLGEWFEGYHEWHASLDPGNGTQKIRLWDYENGYRSLSGLESVELVRQAACILTRLFDRSSFRQVHPWHHGAGDFIAGSRDGTLSVKLITIRGYEPLVHFAQDGPGNSLAAMIHFLLNLSIKMRLDRLDGVGRPVLLGDFAVPAAVAGFFEGFDTGRDKNRAPVSAPEFLEIMQSFSAPELCGIYGTILEIYAEEDQDDFHLIQAELPRHAELLHEALKEFSL